MLRFFKRLLKSIFQEKNNLQEKSNEKVSEWYRNSPGYDNSISHVERDYLPGVNDEYSNPR